MTNVRDIFDIRGGMDGLTRRGIEQVFTEEIGKVALKSRGDGLMGGNLLPYIQGRDAAAQGKMPLLMITETLQPGSRGFSLPAFAHARAAGLSNAPLGGATDISKVFGKSHFSLHPGIGATVFDAFVPSSTGSHFELFEALNKAKNPEKLIDDMIIRAIGPGGHDVTSPVHYMIPETTENAGKLQKEFAKARAITNSTRDAQLIARAEVTKDVLKTMSYDDKLAMMIPRMTMNQDMLRYDPDLFKAIDSKIANTPMVDILEEMGFMDKGRLTLTGKTVLNNKIPEIEELRHLLRLQEEAKLSGSVPPFLDALHNRFTFAHELDHVRDSLDLHGGQYGRLPAKDTPALTKRLQDMLVEHDKVKGFRPARTEMERAADLAGFRSLADVTSGTPNLSSGKEGIPRSVALGRFRQATDPMSFYRHGITSAEQAFSVPKFAGLRSPLPIRTFGVLGAIGLLGLLAAGGAAAAGGSRGNA
jgi:hypothetical protein